MSEENFEPKLGEPTHLKPEELKIWREMQVIFDSYNSKLDKIFSEDFEKPNEIQNKKIDFKNKLIAEGVDPYEFLLFHDLIGSGVSQLNLKLDTKDHRVEKFIRELYAEYKQ